MSTLSDVSSTPANIEGSLRILVLDGAGIRGLTQLYLLKALLESHRDITRRRAISNPADLFDLIIGSSTGGLSAILLGRLGLSIDDAISSYIALGKESFSKYQQDCGADAGSIASQSRHRSRFGKAMNGFFKGASWGGGQVLMESMMGVLADHGFDLNEAFAPPEEVQDDFPCKTVLVLTRKSTLAPELLRSWATAHRHHAKSDPYVNPVCCVWEAAGAVTATSPYFDNVRFEKTGDRFQSAAPSLANPIRLAVTEAQVAFPTRQIGIIVSLGAGKADVGDSTVPGWLKKCTEMMQAAEEADREFRNTSNGYSLLKYGSYYRFNVPLTSAKLEIDECEQSSKMQEIVSLFCRDSERDIERCAKALAQPD